MLMDWQPVRIGPALSHSCALNIKHCSNLQLAIVSTPLSPCKALPCLYHVCARAEFTLPTQGSACAGTPFDFQCPTGFVTKMTLNKGPWLIGVGDFECSDGYNTTDMYGPRESIDESELATDTSPKGYTAMHFVFDQWTVLSFALVTASGGVTRYPSPYTEGTPASLACPPGTLISGVVGTSGDCGWPGVVRLGLSCRSACLQPAPSTSQALVACTTGTATEIITVGKNCTEQCDGGSGSVSTAICAASGLWSITNECEGSGTGRLNGSCACVLCAHSSPSTFGAAVTVQA